MSARPSPSEQWWARALEVCPGGAQNPNKIPRLSQGSPLLLQRGRGSQVWTVEGRQYTDWSMGMGPLILGHAHPAVSEAVSRVAREGNLFSLPHPLEVEVAELLRELVPGAQQVRFALSGSDATAGAVRLARHLSGREHLICTGFHGYQDWYAASQPGLAAGVPARLGELIHPVAFGSLPQLQAALTQYPVAAVLMEIPREEPPAHYLQAALNLAHQHGALLILDETATSFRYALGGAQQLYGLTPDLTCLGKAMANGYPLSAVLGPHHLMEGFQEIFFSISYAGEASGLAAAHACLTLLKEGEALPQIWETGRQLREGLLCRAEEHRLCLRLPGNPVRFRPEFSRQPGGPAEERIRQQFLDENARRGVLLGGSVYPSLAHTPEDLQQTLRVVEEVFHLMRASGEA